MWAFFIAQRCAIRHAIGKMNRLHHYPHLPFRPREFRANFYGIDDVIEQRHWAGYFRRGELTLTSQPPHPCRADFVLCHYLFHHPGSSTDELRAYALYLSLPDVSLTAVLSIFKGMEIIRTSGGRHWLTPIGSKLYAWWRCMQDMAVHMAQVMMPIALSEGKGAEVFARGCSLDSTCKIFGTLPPAPSPQELSPYRERIRAGHTVRRHYQHQVNATARAEIKTGQRAFGVRRPIWLTGEPDPPPAGEQVV